MVSGLECVVTDSQIGCDPSRSGNVPPEVLDHERAIWSMYHSIGAVDTIRLVATELHRLERQAVALREMWAESDAFFGEDQ